MKEQSLPSDFPHSKKESILPNDIVVGSAAKTLIQQNTILLDIIRDAVFFLDKDMKIISANKTAEETYGWSKKEFNGKKITELLQSRVISNTLEEVRESLGTKGYYHGEVIHTSRSGQSVYTYLTASSIPDEAGNFSGMIAICRNITDNKKNESKMAYHAALLENIRDAVMSLDKDFRILSWNKGAEEMYGWTEEEAIGKKSFELLQTDYGNITIHQILEELQHKGFFRGEVVQRTKSGELIDIYKSESALYASDGNLTIIVTINKNISERKRNERELASLNASLEQKIRNRTQELTSIFERITDGFAAIDKEWNITLINEKGAEIFQMSFDKMIGKNIWQLFPEAIGAPFHTCCLQAMETQEPIYKEDHNPIYGNWIEFNIYPSADGISIYFRDITGTKRSEEKLNKANRLFQFISHINQMIVRTKDKDFLFREACRIAIEVGKFKMAWIGLIDEKTKELVPVMFDGLDTDYLSKIRIISQTTKPEGRGPAGTAINENRIVYCNDIATDPIMEPWREEALKRNYRSSIGVPLRKFGKVIGILNLYSETPEFFDQQETLLLEEVAGDISFTLEILEKEGFRKKAEESVLKSERRYHTLTEVSPVGIFHTTKEGACTYVNNRWCEIAGISRTEALGNGWLDAIHTDDRQRLTESWITPDAGHKITISDFRFLHKDASLKWVIAQVMAERNSENQVIGFVGTITDITERKKKEDEINKAIEQLTISQKIAHIGYWEIDLVNNNNYWSDEMYQLCEIDDKTSVISPASFFDFIHPDDKDLLSEMLTAVMHNEKQFLSAEYRFIKKDGSIHHMFSTGECVTDANGKPIRVNGTMQDITQLKEIQTEISREKYLSDSLINSLPGIYYLMDQGGNFIRWNKNLETITGYSAEELSHMNRKEMLPEEEKMKHILSMTETFETDKITALFHFITKSGEKIPFYLTGNAVDYNNEKCLMVIGINFTETLKYQDEIRKSAAELQELTSHLQTIREEERKRIGRELHDELGQQLTAMKMDIAWINKKIAAEESPVIKEKLNNVIELLDGSNTSLRRILNELRPTILDQYGLMDALNWHARQFSSNTGIPLEILSSEKEIRVNEELATCIFRIFQEALTNITRYAQANKVVTHIQIIDRHIQIRIEDNGIGFDTQSEQPKSRQPFGILGMRERVRALNGKFELTSAPGKGTSIFLSLPLKY